jgi:hypothetical protein
MREAIYHSLLTNPIIFPNLALVTLQPPNTATGIIDSASFTNPRNCIPAFPKGSINAILQHSFNQNNATSVATAGISLLRDLISRIDNHNTPGITGTPLTGHAWRNQTVIAFASNTERIVALANPIFPSSTATFSRQLSVIGATNFYYVTVENWNAAFGIIAL